MVVVATVATVALIALALLASTGRLSAPSSMGTGSDQPPGKYQYLDEEQQTLFRSGKGAASDPGQRHRIQISRRAAQAAVQTGSVDVQLPDGTRFPVVFDREETSPEGDWTLVGRVPSSPGAAVITFGRDGVFGVLPTPDGRMLQISTVRGESFIGPAGGIIPPGVVKPRRDFVAPAAAQPRMVGGSSAVRPNVVGAPAPAGGRAGAARSTSNSTLPATGEVRIDVLGLYTTDLVALRGSVSAAKTEFTHLIAVANQAHIDSGSVVRLRLVATQQTNYPANSFNDAALSALQANALPDGLDVRALRDASAADLVAMLRPYHDGDYSCGIANLGAASLHPETASADTGFSVSDTGSCGPLVLAHELGHNLGSMHDIQTSTDADGGIQYGAYPFSFGYRQDGPPAFATVMAYAIGNQPWLGYFSSPAIAVCGAPCGVADQADNVRSLNLMARTISRYRDPLNTISITDASVTETDAETVTLTFTVKLSSPAPAGGVRFDVLTSNGTATAGHDYVSRSLIGQVIAEGNTSMTFDVNVLPDTLVEADETVLAVLRNVAGMAVFDPQGVGTIRNDDPRATLSGRVLFPSGAVPPASAFSLCGSSPHEWLCTAVSPPEFRYSLKFPPGETVTLYVFPGEPFIDEEIAIGRVDASMVRDIPVRQAAYVTGRVVTPANEPPLTAPVHVTIWGYRGNAWGAVLTAEPPNFTFRQAVIPGSNVILEVNSPPVPYVGQRVKLGVVSANVARNIGLRGIPGILVDDLAFAEGASGTHGSWGFGLRLSAPAPAGGVTLDVATANGSAAAGSDYGRIATTSLTIPEGRMLAQLSVDVFGDDVPERDEVFTVSVSNVRGAWLADAQGTGRILNDDIRKVASDFNGDGLSDILWRNARSGANMIWRAASSASPQTIGAAAVAMKAVGTGDFDGDGRGDILWRNSSTGVNTIWKSGNKATVQSVAGITSQAWHVAGVGDFDGDGRADILWRNTSTGANTIWKAANKATQLVVASLAAPDWDVAGVGDFDNDRRADILWRNRVTGANVIWKAGNQATMQAVTARADQAWQVAAVSDFNNDHKADILWRNASTGENAIWRSANATVVQAVSPMSDSAWKVAATGDYNGDGYADILWRNAGTGENRIWRAGKAASPQIVSALADLNWSAAP
jgi:hypothetical protein